MNTTCAERDGMHSCSRFPGHKYGHRCSCGFRWETFPQTPDEQHETKWVDSTGLKVRELQACFAHYIRTGAGNWPIKVEPYEAWRDGDIPLEHNTVYLFFNQDGRITLVVAD